MRGLMILILTAGWLVLAGVAGPTCTEVKTAYRKAKCCGAADASTRKTDLPDDTTFLRPGCNSKVAKSSTSAPIVGGSLYAYNPAGGVHEWMEMPNGKRYVDLAESSIVAGCVPKHKPHMVLPSPDGKHTAVTYTGDQDFAILRNDEKKVIYCPTVDYVKPHVFGGATHTGAWYGNDYFLLLDMTGCVDGVCGGGVYKFKFTFNQDGIMDSSAFHSALGVSGVATGRNTTATKPIALDTNPLGAYRDLFFVTDAKGSGSIMNASTMTWVKHFPVSDFDNCSGGGLWVVPHPSDEKIVLAQYGKQGDADTPGASCIFKVDLAAKTLTRLAQLGDNVDAHGMQFCSTNSGELRVINTNRQTSTLDVIDYNTGSMVLQGWDMNVNVFNDMKMSFITEGASPSDKDATLPKKLQPDVAYLHDNFLYMAARGPKPVSAVKAQNYLPNAHPGIMAIKIDPATCLPAKDQAGAFALTCLERSPEITSDVHGAWGVSNNGNLEIWAVDQAGTGSVKAFYVYSDCAAEGTTPHKDPPF